MATLTINGTPTALTVAVVGAQGPAGPSVSPGTAGQFYVTNAGATAPAWASISGDITASASTVGQLTVAAIQGVVISGTPSTGQVLTATGGTAAHWAAASGITALTGDVTASGTGSVAATVARINGATVPAAGSLTTGNTLGVTGASALGYSALNLAGGAGYVTGVLPAANQASQTMGGDMVGTTAAAYVSTLSGNSSATAPVTLLGTYIGVSGSGTYGTLGAIRSFDSGSGFNILGSYTPSASYVALSTGGATLYVGGDYNQAHSFGTVFIEATNIIGLYSTQGNYMLYANENSTLLSIGGAGSGAPIVITWGTSPTITSGASATSLTVGTNKASASLILQQDAGITAWTLSGGNALAMQAPSTATSISINQAATSTANGATMTIAAQTSSVGGGTGGQLALQSGGGAAQAGALLLQVGSQTILGIGLGSSGGLWMPAGAAAVSSGATSLTAAQYLRALIQVTGSLTNNATVVFPNQIGFWIVDISGVTLNAHTLAFTSGSTTTTAISTITAAGDLVFISCYGGNTIVMTY
jgi:hypothetical protein